MPPQIRQHRWVGIAAGEIAHTAGRRGRDGRGGGGGANARSAAPLGDRQAALLQDSIRCGDRRPADAKAFGEIADGGELLAGFDLPGCHRGLGAARDLDRRLPVDVFLF